MLRLEFSSELPGATAIFHIDDDTVVVINPAIIDLGDHATYLAVLGAAFDAGGVPLAASENFAFTLAG